MSPEEWAMRFLEALLPFYAPLVVYLIAAITLALSTMVIWKVNGFRRDLRALIVAFNKHQEANNAALEDVSMVQRNFIFETLDIQRKAATKQEEQMNGLIRVLDRFLGQAPNVAVSPPEGSPAALHAVQPEGYKPG